MTALKSVASALLVAIAPLSEAQPLQPPVPSSFESTGPDRQAIETLLETYTRAVSTKDQALFESILLNKAIPFSDAGSAIKSNGAEGGTSRYDAFRKGVFEGAAFTQKFQDVHISQRGPLADVTLVYVNSSADGSGWGWKTMQLLKVAGHWKIASEFFA